MIEIAEWKKISIFSIFFFLNKLDQIDLGLFFKHVLTFVPPSEVARIEFEHEDNSNS